MMIGESFYDILPPSFWGSVLKLKSDIVASQQCYPKYDDFVARTNDFDSNANPWTWAFDQLN